MNSFELNRRELLRLLGASVAAYPSLASASGAASAAASTWPAEARDYRFHMIGGAHIDPVWLWPWWEGLSVVHSTFRSALDRMAETPDFRFTASSAQFYEWVAENDPPMLEEIRKRVEEGRWNIVGGWWVEPDVNIPSGEALVRQGFYGQLLYRKLFGRTAKVGYNPDSFGHPGTLPQILKLQGLEDYCFLRPMPHEKPLPAHLFWWEGPDGSKVLAYRIPLSYNDEHQVEKRLDAIIDYKEAVKDAMAFYGVGDHGGGPTKENIQSILSVSKESGAPTLVFSTPELYFAEIRKTHGADLPVVKDDLQMHAIGCYTAESEIKKSNRTAELILTTGEKLAALGYAVAGTSYSNQDFASAWKKVLFLQFHDSLAGSALPEHYSGRSRQGYGYAMEVGNQAIYKAAQKIAWEIPAEDPGSHYLVVFNPHAWDAKLDTEYDLDWPPESGYDPKKPMPASALEDETGTTLDHQWTAATTVIGRRRLVFKAPVPAFGYRQFRLRTATAASAPAVPVQVGERTLENEHLKVTLQEDGTIALFDKDAGRSVFPAEANGARAVIIDDPSDTWSHDVISFSKEIGQFGYAKFRVLESGPMRGCIRARSIFGPSSLEIDWILYAGSRTVEARLSLDWHEHLRMVKFSFPVDVEDPVATSEVPYGHIVHFTDDREVPGQRWIDVTGKRAGQPYGLAVINDAKYGYSFRGSDLRVSLVRGAVYAQHRPFALQPEGVYIWQDQGLQTLRVLLAPHQGQWQDAGLVRLAEEFNSPAPIIFQGIHKGQRPQSASFLSVDVPNVVVSVVKKAEEGQDLIVRCYETAGRPAHATLNLGLVKRTWTGDFRPSEIKTLRVPAGGGEIREVNVLEE